MNIFKIFDSTVVTDANVKVMGSQSIKHRLGIGTDDPMASLHIQVPSISSLYRYKYKKVTRYQGDVAWGMNNSTLYFDNFIGNDYTPVHIQGTTLDNENTTPQTLSTWIKWRFRSIPIHFPRKKA